MKKQIATAIIILISSKSFGLTTYDHKADINSLRQIADGAKRHAEQVRHWRDQAMQWKQTLDHYTNQQATMKDQLASLTNIRDIGDLEGQIDSLIYEMDGIERHRSMFTALLSSSDPEINGEANQILNKYQMFDMCQKKAAQDSTISAKKRSLTKLALLKQAKRLKRK